MHLIRIAESTVLNNAWIVGILAVAALLATWLLVSFTSFLVRQATRSLRIEAMQLFTDAYAKNARIVGILLSFLAMVAAAGTLGYALWRDVDLQVPADELLADVTLESLIALAGHVGVLLLFLLVFYALRIASRRVIVRLRSRVAPDQGVGRQQIFLEKFFLHLPSAINLALAYALLGVAVGTFALPHGLEWFLLTAVYALLLLASGRTLVMFAHFLSERLLARWEHKSKGSKLEEFYSALQRLLPVIQRSIEAIVYVSVATLLVRRFEALAPFSPYGPLLIRIISMFLAASVVVEVVRVLVARLLLAEASAAEDTQRRRITFVGLIQSMAKYLIYFVVAMMVLEDMGINPGPILAGAGILGLTVGLGAQTIVQDLLNGLFLLFEDQILQGDYIKIGDTEGQVEQMSLRLTRVRDRFGRLHILRNGQVQNVINYSRGWTLTVVEMSVSYEDDLGVALRVINESIAKLPALLPAQVLEAPQMKGIETIGDSALQIRIETKVAPGAHFDVKRTLNRLLVDGFTANGLEIPYPKSVQFSPEPKDPTAAEADAAALQLPIGVPNPATPVAPTNPA
jgi:moderate conductance mechanosensitive channel